MNERKFFVDNDGIVDLIWMLDGHSPLKCVGEIHSDGVQMCGMRDRRVSTSELRAIADAIDEHEGRQVGWRVGENPEAPGHYLVSFAGDVDIFRYYGDGTWGPVHGALGRRPLKATWMPLPGPYQGSSE